MKLVVEALFDLTQSVLPLFFEPWSIFCSVSWDLPSPYLHLSSRPSGPWTRWTLEAAACAGLGPAKRGGAAEAAAGGCGGWPEDRPLGRKGAAPWVSLVSNKLDCYWVGSLDFNFLGNQGGFH